MIKLRNSLQKFVNIMFVFFFLLIFKINILLFNEIKFFNRFNVIYFNIWVIEFNEFNG